ncbi:hypothetical protein [Priestia megaterium]|uniref:Flp pilus assembly protein CpaB n=1 Tax=Priestia megaterium TaxID=1404 RepID=A0A6M6E1F0_PRIMG|nr:hypothetical protein [Priestia megaterium]QJX80630.1 hypothetical protein FDZ14_31565 [Priestia megaterium]
MKGRFKDRAKQITLIALFLIISVLTISLIAGRISTQEIIVLKKNGINTSIPLDQQMEFFEKKDILKSEYKYFKGTVVTNVNQLKDKTLIYKLKAGSPIPATALMEPNGAGQFAAVMPEGRTVYMLPEAVLGLPPVQEGDLINIALSYKQKAGEEDDTESVQTGILLSNIKIYKIIDNNIYVDVSLEEHLVLSTASQLGTFVYQIPGQKSELCGENDTNCDTSGSDSTIIKQGDIFDAILNKTYSNTTSNNNIKQDSDEDSTTAEELSKNVVSPKDSKDDSDNKKEEETNSENSGGNTGGDSDEQQ